MKSSRIRKLHISENFVFKRGFLFYESNINNRMVIAILVIIFKRRWLI